MAADPVPHGTTLADALDVARLDELARLAELAASYWRSRRARRRSRRRPHPVTVHCQQVAAVTREAFALARTLGSSEVGQ